MATREPFTIKDFFGMVLREAKPQKRLWLAVAHWPGAAPLLMGQAVGATKHEAWLYAKRTWPQVPSWGLRSRR